MTLRQVVAGICLALAYVVGLALLLANLLAGFGLAGMQIVVLVLVLMLWPASRLVREFAGTVGPPMLTGWGEGGTVPSMAIGFIVGIAALVLVEAVAGVRPGVAGALGLVIGCSAVILLVIFGRRGGPSR